MANGQDAATDGKDDFLAYLVAEEERLCQEIKDAQARLERVSTSRAMYEEWEKGAPRREPPQDPRFTEFVQAIKARCRTQREALWVIATMNEGKVREMEAGRAIIAANLSRGKLASVVSTIHKYMNESENWAWTEPGVFHHKDFMPPRSGGLGPLPQADGSDLLGNTSEPSPGHSLENAPAIIE